MPGRELLFFLYVFVAGHVLVFVDVLVDDVKPLYICIVGTFFLGSLCAASAVDAQITMNKQLRDKTLEVLRTFVNAIDMKDCYTKGHSEHVYEIVDTFCRYLEKNGFRIAYKGKLLDAALLHDCGKISIQDSILNKMGPLTDEEWSIIRTHPVQGKKMLDDTCFRDISNWVLYHHERMDGAGYYGLAGEEIPVESRIIAIADTYSALCTSRVYRARRSHGQAIAIMRAAAGTQLDANLLRIFLAIPARELEALLPPEERFDNTARSQQIAA